MPCIANLLTANPAFAFAKAVAIKAGREEAWLSAA